MPKIRLEFIIQKRLVLSDGVHSPLEVTTTRLGAWVRVGKDHVLRRAIIDTGAPLTIVSKSLWALPDIHEQVEWLLFRPGATSLALPTLTLSGQMYPYRVGRLPLQPYDANGASLPPVTMTAQFLEDSPLSNRSSSSVEIILGLIHSILDNHYLVVKSSSGDGKHEAWLTDDRPVSPLLLAKAVL